MSARTTRQTSVWVDTGPQPDARPHADEPDTDPLPVIPTPALQEPR